MSEYLKMADVSIDSAQQGEWGLYLLDGKCNLLAEFSDGNEKVCSYVVHAINHHDSLVAEVERLRELLIDCRELIEYIGNKNGFGDGDINKVLSSIELELTKK